MKHVIREATSDSHGSPRRKQAPKPGGRNGTVRVYKPNPATWALAQQMAGGVSRLFTVADGVIIANSERRPKWIRLCG